mmetsp:Transcript_23645/g.52446  ORF Transcript_23645/g.52446 Transcript_23645/m.52446 type:complete len:246 (+) Transcript_23645:1487-2224(+)
MGCRIAAFRKALLFGVAEHIVGCHRLFSHGLVFRVSLAASPDEALLKAQLQPARDRLSKGQVADAYFDKADALLVLANVVSDLQPHHRHRGHNGDNLLEAPSGKVAAHRICLPDEDIVQENLHRRVGDRVQQQALLRGHEVPTADHLELQLSPWPERFSGPLRPRDATPSRLVERILPELVAAYIRLGEAHVVAVLLASFIEVVVVGSDSCAEGLVGIRRNCGVGRRNVCGLWDCGRSINSLRRR